ncbi:hypothetical protein NIM87_05795 [Devosia sp. XJ19-1]|uniref:Helix-turn-helix domain-containing protein n=1 Tax=Devosia ureilytica TaxID=2952754 RepID=A0A9Q4FRX6_9HYPH|nr:hypothetical protein [Devosia ureilytica]MCP8883004.1 hypothetical protein [Devosia ureilytica]MCP8886628.1 hypothetical protein [Devosia ureilytica]
MTLKPAYSVSQFLSEFAMGRTRFYELVGQGAIRVRKNGNKTIVTGEDAQAFLNSLPIVEPKKAA